MSQQYRLNEQGFPELVTALYSAALDAENWPLFLKQLTNQAGGVATHLFGFDAATSLSYNLLANGYAPEFVETYEAHYGDLNAWAPGFSAHTPRRVIDCQEMCRDEELRKTAFHAEWLLPQEDLSDGGGAILFKEKERFFALGGNIRRKDVDTLKQPWLMLLERLLPDLHQAFEIARALDGKRLSDALLDYNYGGPCTGVFVLRDDHVPVFCNRAGEQMLAVGAPVRIGPSSQLVVCAPGREQLPVSHENTGQSLAYQIKSHHDGQVYDVRYAPIDLGLSPDGMLGWTFGVSERCYVLIVKPIERTLDHSEMFRRCYGLSEAEAQVACSFSHGLSIAEIADQRGVRSVTVANQLKAVMQKSDTHRQAELVSLFWNNPCNDD